MGVYRGGDRGKLSTSLLTKKEFGGGGTKSVGGGTL